MIQLLSPSLFADCSGCGLLRKRKREIFEEDEELSESEYDKLKNADSNMPDNMGLDTDDTGVAKTCSNTFTCNMFCFHSVPLSAVPLFWGWILTRPYGGH